MKRIFQRFLLLLLRSRANSVLKSAKKIIAVTGSLGKTTTKEAIAHVLKTKYDVLVTAEGFNTPIGILLSLLGEKESGFSSVSKWLKILWRVWTKPRPHPEIIVLEYGVDHPGDMDELLAIAHPDHAVVTNIAPVHLGPGQFQDLDAIATEKMKLAAGVREQGIAILNFENQFIREKSKMLQIPIISYGENPGTDFQITNLEERNEGIAFTVQNNSEAVDIALPFYGTYHTATILPAIILGKEFGISLTESAKILRTFQPPAGRGRILNGKNESIIWDSSYNSSPVATQAALRTLSLIPAKRRLALLGNMNELGEQSKKFHEELGKIAAESADLIFFIGKEFAAFEKGVGTKTEVQRFSDAHVVGAFLREILIPGDVLLAKGSQNGVFLERAVKEMLADPTDAKLLCRQGEEWEKKYKIFLTANIEI